jgi:hypothetical protein
MLSHLLRILVILLGAGVAHWLIGKAPVVADTYKQVAQYVILVVAVVWVVVELYKLLMALV